VFLRLNTAGYENSINRATLTMSEGASATPVDTRPRIIVTSSFTGLQAWRFQHFGSPANTGSGADDNDSNQDGETNLLEFATGQDPHASTLTATPLMGATEDLQLTYTRSKAAVADGLSFSVEWSDTLLPDSWSSAGVSESISSENAQTQTVLASLPHNPDGPRFYRLKVMR
jgi:hypothetical protein